MEALIAFYFGWAMGARSGPTGMEELTTALSSLRESEEFAAVVTALRNHLAYILRDIADQVGGENAGPLGMPDVLARVYDLVRPPEGTR